jgi:hypothetical protein
MNPADAEAQPMLPCPFCGIELRVYSEQEGYWHPKSKCALSGFEMDADGYSEVRWNTRTALRTQAPMPGEVGELVEMPACDDREPFGWPLEGTDALESDKDWAVRNWEAVRWLADNHLAIRAAVEAAAHHGSKP